MAEKIAGAATNDNFQSVFFSLINCLIRKWQTIVINTQAEFCLGQQTRSSEPKDVQFPMI